MIRHGIIIAHDVSVVVAEVYSKSEYLSHCPTAPITFDLIHRAQSYDEKIGGATVVYETISDNPGPIDLLVLPRITTKLGSRTESARSASLLPNVIGVTPTPPAPDVSTSTACLTEGGRSLCHGLKSDGPFIDVKIKVPSGFS